MNRAGMATVAASRGMEEPGKQPSAHAVHYLETLLSFLCCYTAFAGVVLNAPPFTIRKPLYIRLQLFFSVWQTAVRLSGLLEHCILMHIMGSIGSWSNIHTYCKLLS